MQRFFSRLELEIVRISLAILAIGLLAIIVIVPLLVLPGYRAIEQENISASAYRVVNGIYFDIDAQYRQMQDWANWHESVDFVRGTYPEFPQKNITPDVFETLGIDAILFWGKDNQPLVFARYLPETGKVSSIDDRQARDLQAAFSNMLAEGEFSLNGLIVVNGEPAIITLGQVDDLLDHHEASGFIGFLKFLDEAYLTRLEAMTGHTLQLKVESADSYPLDRNTPLNISYPDESHIAADFPIPATNGDAVLVGHVEEPLRYSEYTNGIIKNLVLWLVFIGVLTVIVAHRSFHGLIVKRIVSLNSEMKEIIRSGDLERRLMDSSNDEIADLVHDFNQMLEKLYASQRKLEFAQQDAMEASSAKSAFLANMSHELRTPLTAILGYAELLQDPDLNEEDRRSYLQIIRNNGDILLSLINDILDISRVEAGHLELNFSEISLVDVVSDVYSLLRIEAESRGLEFTMAHDKDVPEKVCLDALRVRQILVNLIGNAIKFTEQGSVRISLFYDANRQLAGIKISDTGIGMSEETIGKLFKPFSQGDASTTRRYGGTGLGLSISRQLAQAMAGDITVSSRVGEGSEFVLWLPANPVASTANRSASEASLSVNENMSEAPVTVLVAEDNPVNQLLIKSILTKAGCHVKTANNGAEVLELLSQESVDLLLLDMQMPERDGYEVAVTLREQGCRLPIVALTANAMEGDKERCLAAGCDAFLSKPIDRHLLIRTIQQMTTREGNRKSRTS